jgi:hypothetical protein
VQGELELIATGALIPHEDVEDARVNDVADEIRAAGSFYPPILVDRSTRVILDGHHRWRASVELGLRVLPCYCVDYLGNPLVRVMSRRPGIEVSKDAVIATALSGKTYPRKTTRHMYDLPEWIEPVPLGRLRCEPAG